MRLIVSKPLLAGLLLTSVLTVIALLKPEPAVSADDLLLTARERASPSPELAGTALPWVRSPRPLAQESLAARGFVIAPPPPPKAPVVAPLPVAPPRPVAPMPTFSYVGRMYRDGQVFVFLAHGEDVDVVAQGGDVDHNWRVERVGDDGVELRYLPLNETRQLAISNN